MNPDATLEPEDEAPAVESAQSAPDGGRRTADEPANPDTAALIALVEQLSRTLERSDLVELEVEAEGTGVVLRKPAALAPVVSPAAAGQSGQGGAAGGAAGAGSPAGGAAGGAAGAAEPERPSVKAPLTGIFYTAPAPGSAPYVTVGSHVAAGQVIGLIEAMKLFNEIKSDLAGRVTRVVAESGTLVKARQPLIEVEPE